jgi:hypothetical protein
LGISCGAWSASPRKRTSLSPRPHGPPARFPKSAYKQAFLCALARLKGGPDVPPRHPLLKADAISTDPRWRESYFGDIDYEGVCAPAEDLSEP